MKSNIFLSDKRILAVDFFRGLALFGVVLVHSIMFGVFYTIDNTLATIPLPILILLAPLVLTAPLAGLFAFISAVSKVYISQKRLKNHIPLKIVLQPILLTSAVLLLLHFVYTVIFRDPSSSMFYGNSVNESLLSASIRQWEWTLPRFESLLYMNAISMICMTGLITAAAVRFFSRRKTELNRILKILSAAGIISVFAAPFIWALFWKPFVFFYNSDGALRLLAVPFSFPAARMQNLPGILPFIFFGLWFGFLLSSHPTYGVLIRKTRPFFILFTVLFFCAVGFKVFLTYGVGTVFRNFLERIGLISVFAWNTPGITEKNLMGAFFDYRILPTEFHMFGLMLIFGFFPVLLRYLDYCDADKRIIRQNKIHPIVRFGTLSLTIFFLESSVSLLFSKPFHILLGGELSPQMNPITPDRFMLSPQIWLLFPVIILFFWGILLKFWERIGYAGSLEWIITKATAPLRKLKSEKMNQGAGKQ